MKRETEEEYKKEKKPGKGRPKRVRTRTFLLLYFACDKVEAVVRGLTGTVMAGLTAAEVRCVAPYAAQWRLTARRCALARDARRLRQTALLQRVFEGEGGACFGWSRENENE